MYYHVQILIALSVVLSSINVFAASITGRISDTSGLALQDVLVRIECLSVGPLVDTSFSDSTGIYLFEGMPIGSYKLSIAKVGYTSKDSIFLLGNSDITINFTQNISPVLIGTDHTGDVSGIWLPSGNPHRIINQVVVRGDLYISPGCTVIVYSGQGLLAVQGTLQIGSRSGPRTIINVYDFRSNGTGARISITNCDFTGSLYFGSDFLCDKIQIDSSNIWPGSFVANAADTLSIINSNIYGTHGTDYKGIPYITNIYLQSGVQANSHVLLSNTIFSSAQIDIGSSFLNNYCDISINYCVLPRCALIGWHSAKINHCNFDTLKPIGDASGIYLQEPDSIMNSIILNMTWNYTSNIIYQSPFHYNIISRGPGITHYFGLMTYITTNGKGDSCDLWYNFKTDILYIDSTNIILNNQSPAIGRANDGTNIGYYQGPGIINENMPLAVLSKSFYLYPNPFSQKTTLRLSLNKPEYVTAYIYNIKGNLIATPLNNYLPKGICQIPIEVENMTAGIYVCKILLGTQSMSGKLFLLK